MPPDNQTGSWNEWKIHVLNELDRLCDCHTDLAKAVSDLRITVEGQRVKITLWGMLGGILASGFISIIVAVIIRKAG